MNASPTVCAVTLAVSLIAFPLIITGCGRMDDTAAKANPPATNTVVTPATDTASSPTTPAAQPGAGSNGAVPMESSKNETTPATGSTDSATAPSQNSKQDREAAPASTSTGESAPSQNSKSNP